MAYASEIYADQLSHLKYGYPMWRPEPSNMENVMIGDVGTIIDGQYKHMFSAPRTATHRYNRGVTPDDFKQLIFDSAATLHYDDKLLDANVYCSKSVHITKPRTSEQDISTSPTLSVNFSCSGSNGAILAIPAPADRCSVNSSQSRLFVEYIKSHHESWGTLARDRFALISHPEDIILVRGWVKTTAFTVAAITHKRNSYDFFHALPVEHYTQVQNFSFTQPSSQIIQYRVGPERRLPPALRYSEKDPDFGDPSRINTSPLEAEDFINGTNREHLPDVEPTEPTLYPFPEIPKLRDQCIFLSFYKLKRRGILPERIVAYAEPRDPPSSPSDGEGSHTTAVFSKWNPLDELLDYILRHSDADLAIACDEDVYEVCEGHPWPADFREFYERVAPRIHVDEDRAATLYREEYLPHSVRRRGDTTVDDVKDSKPFPKSDTIDYDMLLTSSKTTSTRRVSEPLAGLISEPLIVFCLQNTFLSQSNLLRTSQMLINQYYDQVSKYLRFGDNISRPTSSPPLLL